MKSMFSRVEENHSNLKEKFNCKCMNVAISEKKDKKEEITDIQCPSQSGFCLVNDSGFCIKDENSPHCTLSPVQNIGETYAKTDLRRSQPKCVDDICSGKFCGKKFRSYKIDINNAEDTGLLADKQCQTCGPSCNPSTCSNRSRRFFISWDKKRTELFFFLIVAFILWICIYASITAFS